LAVAVVGTFLWWRWRRRRLPLPADKWALRALERLQALELPKQGKIERFHTLLANIVRQYLERQCQLPVRRRTTRELLELVGATPKLTAGQQDFLRDFLTRCDLAKFAGGAVTAEECWARAELVRTFLVEHSARHK
jgi:hypothetical protein